MYGRYRWAVRSRLGAPTQVSSPYYFQTDLLLDNIFINNSLDSRGVLVDAHLRLISPLGRVDGCGPSPSTMNSAEVKGKKDPSPAQLCPE
jgi:hypothetical protein